MVEGPIFQEFFFVYYMLLLQYNYNLLSTSQAKINQLCKFEVLMIILAKDVCTTRNIVEGTWGPIYTKAGRLYPLLIL